MSRATFADTGGPLTEPNSSAQFRERAVAVAKTCKGVDTRPCVTGNGVLEVEVVAFE